MIVVSKFKQMLKYYCLYKQMMKHGTNSYLASTHTYHMKMHDPSYLITTGISNTVTGQQESDSFLRQHVSYVEKFACLEH